MPNASPDSKWQKCAELSLKIWKFSNSSSPHIDYTVIMRMPNKVTEIKLCIEHPGYLYFERWMVKTYGNQCKPTSHLDNVESPQEVYPGVSGYQASWCQETFPRCKTHYSLVNRLRIQSAATTLIDMGLCRTREWTVVHMRMTHFKMKLVNVLWVTHKPSHMHCGFTEGSTDTISTASIKWSCIL